jgi:hypothetical protein
MLSSKQEFNLLYGRPIDMSHTIESIAVISKISLEVLKTVHYRGQCSYYSNPTSSINMMMGQETVAQGRVYAFAYIRGSGRPMDLDEDLV